MFPRKKIPQGPRTTEGPVPSYDGRRGESIKRDYTLNISDTAEGRICPIVYGTNRYQPQVVHAEISGSMLYLVYLLGEGEIDSLVEVYIGSEEVYATAVSWCSIVVRTGATDQTEITEVPHANWASSYPGRALLYVRLDLTAAKIAGGLPDLEVVVKGLKVYDTRTSTTAWSENPFLVAYDLMTNVEYGAAIDTALFDTTSWEAAADRCDETVDAAARWRAGFIVTDRRPAIDIVSDMLRITCGGFIYWADGKWYARLDEQNVIGCRPAVTSAVGTTDRAQAFVAPGPRIKVVCKLSLAEGFTSPTLRLRSAVDGADLATSTMVTSVDEVTLVGLGAVSAVGPPLTGGNIRVALAGVKVTSVVGSLARTYATFDFSAYRLTTGATYYIVLNATAGVTWHQCTPSAYVGGSSWDNDGGWAEETTKDFWFQVHYADHELRDALTAISPEIPILASGGKSSLTFSRSREEAPNVVEISYYDQSDWIVKPIRYESSTVQGGTKQPNVLSVQALAVPTNSCAYRLARQWYRIAQRTNRVGCLLPQHGAIIAPGDVVMLTSVIGPVTSAWYRVRSIERRLGSFDLELIQYDWNDYSTEETFALDSVTLPTTINLTQYVNFTDDFGEGDTTSGNVGELGWIISGSGPVLAYVAEANHPGILSLSSSGSGAGIVALSGTSQQFAEKSAWSSEWIFKPSAIAANTQWVRVSGVFAVKIQRDSGVFTLYIDDVSAEKTCVATDWITVQNSCDGGATAWCNIVKNGVVWHQTSKTVSSTTIDKYLSAQASYDAGGTATIKIDKARLSIGATR